MAASRRSAPFNGSRPTSAQGEAEERAGYSRSVMGLLCTIAMSILLPVPTRGLPTCETLV
jgi:hypothetical protein